MGAEGATRIQPIRFAHPTTNFSTGVFRSASGGPLYLGAIWYPLEEAPDVGSFVVLTQEPTPQCAAYHSRMPVLLQPSRLRDWVQSPLPKLHIPSVGSAPPLAITPVGRSAPDPAQATLF